jgi:pullulanase/glycogen debranching enzyme
MRRAHPALSGPALLSGASGPDGIPDVAWLTQGGTAKTPADWEAARAAAMAMVLGRGDGRLAVLFNRSGHEVRFHLPSRPGYRWEDGRAGRILVGPRSVALVAERPDGHDPASPLEGARPGS